jgi:hypothetical protein
MAKVYYDVMEHYDDEPPEPFGSEVLDHAPVPGEIIQLHWLDGADAYRVRVLSVESPFLINVKAVPSADLPPAAS